MRAFRWVALMALASVAGCSIGGVPVFQTVNEHLQFPPNVVLKVPVGTKVQNTDWVPAAMKEEKVSTGSLTTIQFIRGGQTMATATEWLTYQNIMKAPYRSPADYLEALKKEYKCLATYNVLQQSESEILFEIHQPPCGGETRPATHLFRVILGKVNVFWISYNAWLADFAPPQRQAARTLLQSFALIEN